MGELHRDVAKRFGWMNVRKTVQVWTSPEPSIDKNEFSIYLETKNEVGYELCWMIEITESAGRYMLSRTLYGSGRADIYRHGQRRLFELSEIEFDSQAALCNTAVGLAQEFRAALETSLQHVPND